MPPRNPHNLFDQPDDLAEDYDDEPRWGWDGYARDVDDEGGELPDPDFDE